MTSTLRAATKAVEPRIRPYQLTGAKYALWYDVGILGRNDQIAVEQYLCEGSKMITPQGKQLDERSQEVVRMCAEKRGVFIPASAF